MEALRPPNPERAVTLFNSALETGLRSVIVLDALYPRPCAIADVVLFDYVVVHSGVLGGPSSLHPDLPASGGELLVRRKLVEQSLRLMQRVHLVEQVPTDSGFSFVASEDAPAFLDLLQSPYTEALKVRARWIAETLGPLSSADLESLVSERIGRWTSEFAVAGTQGAGEA